MNIVLNELESAENALRKRELTKHPYETLVRVAKYYTYNGTPKNQILPKLEEFLLACDPAASVVKWGKVLSDAAKDGVKYPPVVIKGVGISQTELDKIDSVDSVLARRLAFTLLCIAKYNKKVFPKSSYWVQTKGMNIMAMANIATSVRRQSAIYAQLREAGMVEFPKRVDNLGVKVLFVDDNPAVLEVTDFRNLGYQYMMYRGGPYAVCANCGIVYKRNVEHGKGGRPTKYCRDCAAKIALKQRVESSMRCREKAKKNQDR